MKKAHLFGFVLWLACAALAYHSGAYGWPVLAAISVMMLFAAFYPHEQKREYLPLGTVIPDHGEIKAIGWANGGPTYYFFGDKDNVKMVKSTEVQLGGG